MSMPSLQRKWQKTRQVKQTLLHPAVMHKRNTLPGRPVRSSKRKKGSERYLYTINPTSCECSKVELDLFTVLPTNISMEKGRMIESLLISTLGDGPVNFSINSDEEDIELG